MFFVPKISDSEIFASQDVCDILRPNSVHGYDHDHENCKCVDDDRDFEDKS